MRRGDAEPVGRPVGTPQGYGHPVGRSNPRSPARQPRPRRGRWVRSRAVTVATTLDAAGLRAVVTGFHEVLRGHREVLNLLNVYPVPDGDTGTNMLLTMQAAMERCPDSDEPTVSEVATQLAEGAFFGARGNSGVILSQFFKGLSDALQENETSSVHDLAYAFDLATGEPEPDGAIHHD